MPFLEGFQVETGRKCRRGNVFTCRFLHSWVFSLGHRNDNFWAWVTRSWQTRTEQDGCISWDRWGYTVKQNSLWNLSDLTKFLTHICPMQVGKEPRNFLACPSTIWEEGAWRTTTFKSISFVYQIARNSVISHLTARIPGNVGHLPGWGSPNIPFILNLSIFPSGKTIPNPIWSPQLPENPRFLDGL